MDLRGVSLGRVLPHGCLQELTVLSTTNFFSIGPDSILSSSIQLSSLRTGDVAGALAAPICKFLSSSLTKLSLEDNHEIERFTGEQDDALQLLTSLQDLRFSGCKRLQSLPAGLHRLTSLKTLEIGFCKSIRLLQSAQQSDYLPNSLQNLSISNCSAIVSLAKDGLPNSLQNLSISHCSAIVSLTEDGLPNSLQNLTISFCPAFRTLPKGGLPNSLQNLTIDDCSAIRSLPKDGLPNSLQELKISDCPSIRALPKGVLPTSLKLIDVSDSDSEELKRQCRNLIGSIPIIRA